MLIIEKVKKMHEEIEAFERFEKNEDWFDTHLEDLEEKNRNKFLAVVAPEEVIVDDDLKRLLAKLERDNIDFRSVFITAIPPIGVASIL